jgi:ribosomal protein S18 acetylase RimI-like enzyme
VISCARMSEMSLDAAFGLLQAFLRDDEYYGDSSQAYGDKGAEAIRRALRLLLARPELGFVWLAHLNEKPVAVCVVSFAVSTSIGAVVAKLDDVYVDPADRRKGVGTRHYILLTAELRRLGVERVDTSVHVKNVGARRFYERLGFRSLREERLACVLD